VHTPPSTPTAPTNPASRAVVELGAGAALPSLVAAMQPAAPALVVVTDYPDDAILGNLRQNVARNEAAYAPGCTVRCEGYEWSQPLDPLM